LSAPRAPKAPAMPRRAFRMSLGDFALLDKFAEVAGISDAAYLRWLLRREAGSPAALPVPPKRKRALTASPPPAADPALLLQIAKVGNLLNQVARSANECRKNGSTLDLVQVLAVLLIIQRESESLARPSLDIPPKGTEP
jgi:hypothetical protein